MFTNTWILCLMDYYKALITVYKVSIVICTWLHISYVEAIYCDIQLANANTDCYYSFIWKKLYW